MCEAHAFVLQDHKEVKVLENVDELEVEGDEIRLINIFGEQKILKARVKGYSGSDRKILLEPLRCSCCLACEWGRIMNDL